MGEDDEDEEGDDDEEEGEGEGEDDDDDDDEEEGDLGIYIKKLKNLKKKPETKTTMMMKKRMPLLKKERVLPKTKNHRNSSRPKTVKAKNSTIKVVTVNKK